MKILQFLIIKLALARSRGNSACASGYMNGFTFTSVKHCFSVINAKPVAFNATPRVENCGWKRVIWKLENRVNLFTVRKLLLDLMYVTSQKYFSIPMGNGFVIHCQKTYLL